MRAPLIAIAMVALGILVACGEPSRAPQVRATFVPGAGEPRATATSASSASSTTAPTQASARAPECDYQNSVLQDSGSPLLQIEPASPRVGERVTVTGDRLAPGARTLLVVATLQPMREVPVTVALDGRLRATFPMPPMIPGRCTVLWLDNPGVQSLGFVVAE